MDAMNEFLAAKGKPGTRKAYSAGICSFLSVIFKREPRKLRTQYGKDELDALDKGPGV